MKKVKSFGLSVGMIILISVALSGCSKITPKPKVYHDKARQIGIATITIGVDENLEINSTDMYEVVLIEPEKYPHQSWIDGINKMGRILHKWGNLNTIYRDSNECLVDVDNSGLFTHDAEADKMEDDLEKLGAPIKYKILPITSSYSKIQEPHVYHDESKTTGKTIIRMPALHAIKTVEIGENIYQKINQYTYNTFEVILIKPENTSDSDWKKHSKEPNGGFLSKWTAANHNTICDKDKKRCFVDVDKTNVLMYEIIPSGDNGTINMLSHPLEYKIIPTPPTYDVDSFKYEALYQGRIDNKIKISFREFKDDMARPAFTQDIDYELNKSGDTIVGFKGLRIKILKATNMDITYSVIQDYN